ncbi:hypothetical protein GPROT2_00427 [Gammaproteobacteria bacterium]|nr:hypothetical protein [Gammaproteobacteria bacterium]CAG0938868.1 hypothetical protein GPROT2_00427 [Gammaproteobacteria bacterium]
MTTYMNAWQCIGCGKLEGPRPCIGICQDRQVQLVYAGDYEALQVQAKRLRQRAEALEAVVRQLAGTTPRQGEWERSYRALQERARKALVPSSDESG